MSARMIPSGEQLSLSLAPERRIFRVSELNSAVQALFVSEFRSIWVIGEISGCRAASSGHFYFSLKDDHSQIKCVLFKGNARFAKFKPQDGLAVLARGNLEVYEARGEYQLIVELLEPKGAGTLQIAFEQLKKRLGAEGLFDQSRKRALPKLPMRIGIITSPVGAVIQDMLHVLGRRFCGLHIRLYPAQVQGDGALEQLCAGLRFFDSQGWAEVVILARGGGSLEDLWTFNEEALARAIAASRVPVISAVGHETDFTIADFVADLRAPTPSAAAEIVVPTRESLFEQIDTCRSKAMQALRYRLLLSGRDLQRRGIERAAASIHRALTRRAQYLDDVDLHLQRLLHRSLNIGARRLFELTKRLHATDLRLRLARDRSRQEKLEACLRKAIESRVSQLHRRLGAAGAHLTQLSPLAVLARGYAIIEDHQRRILRSASEVGSGDELRIRLHEGELTASVIGPAVRDE